MHAPSPYTKRLAQRHTILIEAPTRLPPLPLQHLSIIPLHHHPVPLRLHLLPLPRFLSLTSLQPLQQLRLHLLLLAPLFRPFPHSHRSADHRAYDLQGWGLVLLWFRGRGHAHVAEEGEVDCVASKESASLEQKVYGRVGKKEKR